ncbi:MAG: hypothetical protein AAF191_20660, partial [Verrucomicrobiota bacterium]
MSHEADWQSLFQRTRQQVNLGWFLERWALLCLITATIGCVALLVLRSRYPDALPAALPLWGFPALPFLIPVPLAYLWAKKQFLSSKGARLYLEERLALNQALSASAEGGRPWPPLPPNSAINAAGLHWDSFRVVRIPLISLVIFSLALAIPIKPPLPPEAAERPVESPPGWDRLQEKYEELEEESFVVPEASGTWKEELASLRDQPEETWYSHASLEASDSLETSFHQSLAALQEGLAASEAALSSPSESTPGAKAALREALQQLDQSGLPLNDALRQQLAESLNVAPPSGTGANAELLQALQEFQST